MACMPSREVRVRRRVSDGHPDVPRTSMAGSHSLRDGGDRLCIGGHRHRFFVGTTDGLVPRPASRGATMKLFRLPRLYWSDLKLVGIIAWVGWLGFTAKLRSIGLLPATTLRFLT